MIAFDLFMAEMLLLLYYLLELLSLLLFAHQFIMYDLQYQNDVYNNLKCIEQDELNGLGLYSYDCT
jgi:hypothetical protein